MRIYNYSFSEVYTQNTFTGVPIFGMPFLLIIVCFNFNMNTRQMSILTVKCILINLMTAYGTGYMVLRVTPIK